MGSGSGSMCRRICRFSGCCEVYLVQSAEAPGGVGEPGTSGAAPAVTNAIFAATEKRIRQLPIEKALRSS
jgi:isoquinoline 1-oxidoreductase beta subunit